MFNEVNKKKQFIIKAEKIPNEQRETLNLVCEIAITTPACQLSKLESSSILDPEEFQLFDCNKLSLITDLFRVCVSVSLFVCVP